MKVLVISDTHRKIRRVDMILKIFENEEIKHIIHAGDHLEDAEAIQEKYPNIVVHMVPGNCDVEGYGSDTDKLIDIEGVPIFVAHGHKHHVKYDYDEICIDAKAYEAKLAIFGHSHCAYKGMQNGIMLLNPGSLSEPRDSTVPSFAILDINEGSIKDIKVLQMLDNTRVAPHFSC